MSKLGLSLLSLFALGGCSMLSKLAGGGGGGSGGLNLAGGGAWCRNIPEDSQSNSVSDALSDDGTYDRIIPALAQTLCHPDEEASSKHGELEAARKKWMATMQMTDADWASDVPAFAAIPFDERNAGHIARAADRLAWSTMGPVDQYSLLAEISGEDTFATRAGVYHYIADALPLTEAGRVAYIERCITGDDPKPVEWAMCQGDIEALDRTKFGAELRGDGHRKAAEKMWVRFALAKVESALPAHAEAVKQLDATHAKLFAIAKTSRSAWTAALADRAVALGLVSALDDARATGVKTAPPACQKAAALFATAVSGLPASKFENVIGDPDRAVSFTEMGLGIAVRDPDIYFAVNALVACQGQPDFLLDRMTTQLDRWPGARGPRTAALTAMRVSGAEIEEFPDVDMRLPIGGQKPAAYAEQTSGKGIVQSVKSKGTQVVVTMKKQSQMFDFCTDLRTTNRITRITADGHVWYETVCMNYASHRVETTPGPFTIESRYATAITPGQYIRVAGNVTEGVWSAANAPKPTAIWGIALK